jgi:hypothetical protein
MTTLLPAPAGVHATSVTRPSTAHLLDTPLPHLLAEFNVDVTVLETDPGFTGGACVRADGSLLFVRPAGRRETEWEIVARAMLGQVLRVPMPPMPDLFKLTEVAPDAGSRGQA